MKRLEHPQRELLMEAYQPRVSIRDLAAQSGRSITGFYQWLHRVRRLLLDCVRREFAREALS
jgi:RNA polymerase sigma-70 factor (ECF subfamily)